MTGQQLKNSILQMAVQGKLVPQDPNDEPASVLLERIRAEKERLIKEKKIKKEKNPSVIFRSTDNSPYTFLEKIGDEIRDISDEIPFDIPESWEWVRLSTISTVITKGTTPRGGNVAYLNKGIGFLRAENVAGLDKLCKNNLNYIDEETHHNFLKRSILNENDILITIAGTLGRTAIVRKKDLPLNANQAVSIVRLVNVLDIELKYLIFALNSPNIQMRLTEQKKITAIPNLTLEIISDCFIPIPPLAEQHRIVAKIEELLPYIENYTEVETKLNALNTTFPTQLKKSILQQAVQGKLVPQNPDDEPASVLLERIRAEKQELIKAGKIKKDKNESVIFRRDNSHYEMVSGVERCIDDEIPFEVPENWDFTRLFTICIKDVKRGKSPKYGKNNNVLVFAQKCNTKSGDIKLDLAQGLDNDAFNKYPSDEIMCDNDIIVNSTGTGTLGRIGFYTKSDNPTNAVVVPDSHVTVVRITNSVDSKFIYHCLKYYQPILEEQGEGSTNQKELKPYTISNLIIPLPPLSEQYRIVEKIEELIKVCEKL